LVSPKLIVQIDYYNDHLKLLNRGISTPRLYQDIILSNKSKGDPRVKYRKNYNLMHDGVHPIRTLAKLWAAKLVELALVME
jgi:phosphopantetheinyl transferase (holo-ACP synthase)